MVVDVAAVKPIPLTPSDDVLNGFLRSLIKLLTILLVVPTTFNCIPCTVVVETAVAVLNARLKILFLVMLSVVVAAEA